MTYKPFLTGASVLSSQLSVDEITARKMYDDYNKLWNNSTGHLPDLQTLEEHNRKEYVRNAEQRTKYSFSQYINILNSYMYKELCIFKPIGRIQQVLNLINKQIRMDNMWGDPFIMGYSFRSSLADIKQVHVSDDHIDSLSQMAFGIHSSHDPQKAKYILNYKENDPFFTSNKLIGEDIEIALFNYDIRCALRDKDIKAVEALVYNSAFIVYKHVSKANLTRMKLLGIKPMTSAWDLGKSISQPQWYGSSASSIAIPIANKTILP